MKTIRQDLDALPLEEIQLLNKSPWIQYVCWEMAFTAQSSHGFDINIGFEKGPMGGYYSPYKNPKLSASKYLTDITDEANIIEIEVHLPILFHIMSLQANLEFRLFQRKIKNEPML